MRRSYAAGAAASSSAASSARARAPVRQWVLSFPKRLRYFLQRDAELAGRVLRVFLRAVESKLRAASPGAPPEARFGGVTFVERPSRASGHASARR